MAIFYGSIVTLCIILVMGGAISLFGPGTLARVTTLTGIYVVCKPDGYPVLCMGDKTGKDGGVSCVRYDEACK